MTRSYLFLIGTLTAVLSADTATAQECVGWDNASRTGQLDHDAVDESSGLAASRRHDGLLWTHNDSGDSPRLFLMETDGTHVAQISLEGAAKARDWEDMAIGPCEPDSNAEEASKESCVYVGDFGDNRKNREHVVIYRFPEPALPEARPAKVEIQQTDAIWFTYPGGARNAEALMVHPKTAELYVVEKSSAAASKVYEVPNQPAAADKAHQASQVGELEFESMGGFGKMITAGDIAPDGSEFTVRTYLGIYTYCVGDDEDFEAALSTKPTAGRPPFMIQSEAMAYGADGRSVWMTSEGQPSPLYRLERADKDTEPDSD
ncbi:MAG: hypothetical protein ACLFVJ_03375 [Persicimonas sp.]